MTTSLPSAVATTTSCETTVLDAASNTHTSARPVADVVRDEEVKPGRFCPRNAALIDKHWNPILAAWYPEGKDDPHLTLLRFDADDGRVWVSKKGPVRFMFEVAKANLTKTLPDVGGVADVNLN